MDFGLESLNECIAEMHEEKLERQEMAVCAAIEQVKVTQSPFATLPVQSGSSLELHSAIVQHYQQRHQIGEKIRTERRRKTERGRIAKRKGADYKDKQEQKLGVGRGRPSLSTNSQRGGSRRRGSSNRTR